MGIKPKINNLVIITIFMVTLIFPNAIWVTIGDPTHSSVNEVSSPAPFPNKLSDDFIEDFSLYYEDRLPFRSFLINTKNSAFAFAGKQYRETVNPRLSYAFTPTWYQAEESKAPYRALSLDNDVIYGRGASEWLFYSGEDSLAYYAGSNIATKAEMDEWSKIYERLNAAAKAKGAQLVVVQAPNKEDVYSQFMPSIFKENPKNRNQVFASYMKENSTAPYLFLGDVIKGDYQGLPTYLQQDTHWNYRGAFLGMKAIYRFIGNPTTNLQNIYTEINPKTGGDLANMCGYNSTYSSYDLKYRPGIKTSYKQVEDADIRVYESTSPTDNNLYIVGDSFQEFLGDLMAKDFRRTVVAHRDYIRTPYFKGLAKEIKAGDLIVLIGVGRYDKEQAIAGRELTQELAHPKR